MKINKLKCCYCNKKLKIPWWKSNQPVNFWYCNKKCSWAFAMSDLFEAQKENKTK